MKKLPLKKFVAMFLAAAMAVSLTACGTDTESRNEGVSSGAISGSADSESVDVISGSAVNTADISIKITANLDSDFSIQNPETAEGPVELAVFEEDPDVDIDNYDVLDGKDGTSHEVYSEEYQKAFVDASFLGIKEKVRINTVEVASVGVGETITIPTIYDGFKTKRKSKDKKGDCLVVTLEGLSDEDVHYGAMYLAVLDYQNRKSYLTSLSASPSADTEQVTCCDLTGDDRDEIIFANSPGRGVDWASYQLKENKLHCLYNAGEEEWQSKEFKITLLDDYKLKMEAENYGLEQTISLMKLGLKKSNLEVVPDKQISDDDWLSQHFRCYKNGKLKENIADIIDLSNYFSPDDEEWTCFEKGNAKDGIRIPLTIHLTKWVCVGKAYAIMKYNSKSGKLEMTGTDVRWMKVDKSTLEELELSE